MGAHWPNHEVEEGELRVLVVPDKFKGTLTAQEAAEAIARGWRSARPDDNVDLLPMSDGGDGFGEIISTLVGAKAKTISTVDAAHRACEALWWFHEQTRRAIIESARVIGLAQLPRGKYHPFELDTKGLGDVLKATAKHGAQRCIMGIGGSATNDAGFGMARALGWSFLDEREGNIDRWTELHRLSRVDPPERKRLFDELIVAVDVQNPLLGPEGCSRVYGPQKGLRPEDFSRAEQCLERLAKILKQQLGLDFAKVPGAGAAGGLGFGLLTFTGAQLVPGFDLFAKHARLDERMKSCDLVITGEGAIDQQTLMGKGVGQIARRCRESTVPCIALAGTIEEGAEPRKLFAQTRALTEITSTEDAVSRAGYWLEKLATHAAKQQ
jgi:glycerate kinase